MAASNASTASRCHALLTESLTKLTWWLSTILRIRRRGRSRNSSILFLLTLAALATRLHRISVDNRVVWDETHFGRFATRYINGEFYLDVHPPLGKLLLTLVYRTLGYIGDFEFNSGDTYPSSVPFVAARCVQAFLGALLAPVSVLILQTLHLPAAWAWTAGASVALDNALIGISRIVVLDSMLLLANASSVYAFLCFKQAQKRRLQLALVLGAALGLLCSIKLVGLLTLAVFNAFLIGDIIIYRGTAKGWLQELICLLSINGIPSLVYVLGFLAQSSIFRNYTPEADHMGSEYVTRLNNSALSLQHPTTRSGSFVVLRAAEYPFAYLSAYAASNSSEYVLATRRRLAVEDYWRVQPPSSSGFSNKKPIGYGDTISLFVPKTSVRVSVLRRGLVGLENKSRNENASADTAFYNRELTETGASGWRIIPDRRHGNAHGFIPVVSKFRLQSIKHDCELAIDYRRLLYDEHLIDNPGSVPRQHLFKCAERGRGTLWNIEHHLSTVAETPINLSQYVCVSHFRDFSSYNRLMRELNGMLVSDPDQISPVESPPLGWPFLADPMPMVQWQPEDASAKKYMLIGNPALWWLSALVYLMAK
ncbi:Protein O-mannosyltransferase 2 [Coemansia sp. RSA 1286]|nr:Protein O-mannosyltransferase 2 [Coemansia sp. RSA 485]KAJ2637364.1 Protein O-mannosyltransferase 2 [Coemansia sp. RSA 1286]